MLRACDQPDVFGRTDSDYQKFKSSANHSSIRKLEPPLWHDS